MTKFNLDKLREITKPRELSRAEEMALKAYPDEMVTTLARGNKFRAGPIYRKGFVQGYEQAEKDLGWISVLERLPEPGEWVFVCIDDCGEPQCLSLAAYNERTGIWINDRDEMVHLDYWMPIPGFRKEASVRERADSESNMQ